MNRQERSLRVIRLAAWAGLGGMVAALALVVPAVAQTAAQVTAGQQVWQDAGCDGCHGANGQGGTSPDLPHGPSLRATKLDHDGLVQVISCGRPNTQMPAWLKGAYTVVPCNGLPVGAIPDGSVVVGVYTADQIGALVDYLSATFVGK